MLENLIETLLARRTPLLRKELELLQQSTKRADMEDQILADIGDLQGMGGVHEDLLCTTADYRD